MSMKHYDGVLQGGRGDGNRNPGKEPSRKKHVRRSKRLELNPEEQQLINIASPLVNLLVYPSYYPLPDKIDMDPTKMYRFIYSDNTDIQEALTKAHISFEEKVCEMFPTVYVQHIYDKPERDKPIKLYGKINNATKRNGKLLSFKPEDIEKYLTSPALEIVLEKARKTLKAGVFCDVGEEVVDMETLKVLNYRPIALRCAKQNIEAQELLKEMYNIAEQEAVQERSGNKEHPLIKDHQAGGLAI